MPKPEYYNDKKTIYLTDNYHRLLKKMAVEKGVTMRDLLHEIIEDRWIEYSKKKKDQEEEEEGE